MCVLKATFSPLGKDSQRESHFFPITPSTGSFPWLLPLLNLDPENQSLWCLKLTGLLLLSHLAYPGPELRAAALLCAPGAALLNGPLPPGHRPHRLTDEVGFEPWGTRLASPLPSGTAFGAWIQLRICELGSFYLTNGEPESLKANDRNFRTTACPLSPLFLFSCQLRFFWIPH